MVVTHILDSYTICSEMEGCAGGWPDHWTLAGVSSCGHCHSGSCNDGHKGAVTSQCTPCCCDSNFHAICDVRHIGEQANLYLWL